MSGTPALRATCATAPMSVMRPPDCDLLVKIALVLGDSDRSKLFGSSMSAHTTCQPKDLRNG